MLTYENLKKLIGPTGFELMSRMSLKPVLNIGKGIEGTGWIRPNLDGTHKFKILAKLSPDEVNAFNERMRNKGNTVLGLILLDCAGSTWQATGYHSWAISLSDFDNQAEINGTCNSLTVEVQSSGIRQVRLWLDDFELPLPSDETNHFVDTGELQVKVTVSKEEGSVRKNSELTVEVKDSHNLHNVIDTLTAPFTGLIGVLRTPRLVLWDDGGRAYVRINSKHSGVHRIGGAAFILELITPDRFWLYYASFVNYLQGNKKINSSWLPGLLEEVTKAADSLSPWVSALAISSAIEGACKLSPEWGATPSTYTSEEISEAVAALKSISCIKLRDSLEKRVNELSGLQQPTATKVLKRLVENNVISVKHKNAWGTLRHRVAHGNLIGIEASLDKEKGLPVLLELFHLLTANVVGYDKNRHRLTDETQVLITTLKKTVGY